MPPAHLDDRKLPSNSYTLKVRQEPERARVVGKEKDRKPIDPPPIVQLWVRDPNDPAQNFLQSPYYFVCCYLWHQTEDRAILTDENQPALTGSLVSSLHRLKDMDISDGGFFVFGDLSAKVEGTFRLKFTLFEIFQGQVASIQSIISQPFLVYPAKTFPGMAESTFLSRSFGDQGVRLRIRKESRQMLKRPASTGQSPPTYSTQARQEFSSSQGHVHSHNFTEPTAKRRRSADANSNAGPDALQTQAIWPYSQTHVSSMYTPTSAPISAYAQDEAGLRYTSDNSKSYVPGYSSTYQPGIENQASYTGRQAMTLPRQDYQTQGNNTFTGLPGAAYGAALQQEAKQFANYSNAAYGTAMQGDSKTYSGQDFSSYQYNQQPGDQSSRAGQFRGDTLGASSICNNNILPPLPFHPAPASHSSSGYSNYLPLDTRYPAQTLQQGQVQTSRTVNGGAYTANQASVPFYST